MTDTQILVIDDEATICNASRLILSENGYRVSTFHTGSEALSTMQSSGADLALLDIQFPDMNGIDILKTIQMTSVDIDIIIMTGFGTVDNAVEAMKNGAVDFITKPFDEDQLVKAVKNAITGRQLRKRNTALKTDYDIKEDFPGIIGNAPSMTREYEQIERVAPMDSTVLLTGESGTGKELFARAIHHLSTRARDPFLAIDCSAISSSLLESELFGHVKGAFTGADTNKQGIFEGVGKGTLFLDEVSNMDWDIQGKLLRVLETGEFKPVGAGRIRKTEARIVAATNRDLGAMADADEFRPDLFYRMNVFPVSIPPLRERQEDIPDIAYFFLKRICSKSGKSIDGFTDDALSTLMEFDWPGNVRQLKNVVERLVIMCDDQGKLNRRILQENLDLHQESADTHHVPETLEGLKLMKKKILEEKFSGLERAFLENALNKSNGNITQAAKNVGMQRSNFSTMMKKHAIHY